MAMCRQLVVLILRWDDDFAVIISCPVHRVVAHTEMSIVIIALQIGEVQKLLWIAPSSVLCSVRSKVFAHSLDFLCDACTIFVYCTCYRVLLRTPCFSKFVRAAFLTLSSMNEHDSMMLLHASNCHMQVFWGGLGALCYESQRRKAARKIGPSWKSTHSPNLQKPEEP